MTPSCFAAIATLAMRQHSRGSFADMRELSSASVNVSFTSRTQPKMPSRPHFSSSHAKLTHSARLLPLQHGSMQLPGELPFANADHFPHRFWLNDLLRQKVHSNCSPHANYSLSLKKRSP